METQEVQGIFLPKGDHHFAKALTGAPLFEGKATYQFHKLNDALRFVGPDWVCAVDVGAHVGLWTRVLARRFTVVHAFEPVEAHSACFKLNLAGYANVRLHRMALANTNGVIGLTLVGDNTGNSRVTSNERPDEIAMCHKLDDVASMLDIHGVNFMKIDVEGYEHEVVLGAEKFIRDNKPVMVVEQKPTHAERYQRHTGDVIKLLERWGASVQWVRAGDYCLKWG